MGYLLKKYYIMKRRWKQIQELKSKNLNYEELKVGQKIGIPCK